MTRKSSATCPCCQKNGRPVKTITLQSLLREEFKEQIGGHDWCFCDTPACEVVYFRADGDGRTFAKEQLTVQVGIKETQAPRTVCYCFDHTVEEIEEEVASTGTTTVLEDIKTRMKQSCWCETTSPMGSCCLGTVTRFVKAAQADLEAGSLSESEEAEDCCSSHGASAQHPEVSQPKERRIGILATGGAVLSAALSSACCWLPLLLLVFGTSAAGVAGFFKAWRPWFLGGAVMLLGAGFYFAYFRKEKCDPDSSCAVPNPRLKRFNRAILWVAAVFVAAFALFPNYLGSIFDAGEGSTSPATTYETMANEPSVIVLSLAGMTCEACAVSLQAKLGTVPGVTQVAVDYEGGNVFILPTGKGAASRAELVKVIEGSGYLVEKARP